MSQSPPGESTIEGRTKFVRLPEGRDEFNLAEFPLTVLTQRTPGGSRTVEWEDEITDRATGLELSLIHI